MTASAAAATGPATVTVTGTGGGSSDDDGRPDGHRDRHADFALSALPASLTIDQGASGTSTIGITRSGGFAGAVTFAASGLPNGVTATFIPLRHRHHQHADVDCLGRGDLGPATVT